METISTKKLDTMQGNELLKVVNDDPVSRQGVSCIVQTDRTRTAGMQQLNSNETIYFTKKKNS